MRELKRKLLPSPLHWEGTQFFTGFTKRFTALKPGIKHRAPPPSDLTAFAPPPPSSGLYPRFNGNKTFNAKTRLEGRRSQQNQRGKEIECAGRYAYNTHCAIILSIGSWLPYTNKMGNEAESSRVLPLWKWLGQFRDNSENRETNTSDSNFEILLKMKLLTWPLSIGHATVRKDSFDKIELGRS